MAARLHRPNQLEIARIFRIYRLDNFGELISIPERSIHSIPTVLYLTLELLKSKVGTCSISEWACEIQGLPWRTCAAGRKEKLSTQLPFSQVT
jgi:hypothetical protein